MLSDLGILPRYRAHLLILDSSHFSLFFVSGWPWMSVVFLLSTMGLAAAVLWNKSNRLLRFGLWLCICSLHYRNPLILDSADDLLRVLLFWDIFLPDEPKRNTRLLNWPVVGLLCQLSIVLAFSAWSLKQSAPEGGLNAVEIPVFAIAAVCLWHRWGRLVWTVPLACVLLARAALLHPIFPLTLAAGWLLVQEWRNDPADSVVTELGSAKLAFFTSLAIFLALSSAAYNVGYTPHKLRHLTDAREILGLEQHWDLIYPLGGPGGRTLFFQTADGIPFEVFGPSEGRRRDLLSRTLTQKPRISRSALQMLAKRHNINGWVELWVAPDGQSEKILEHREQIAQ